MHISGHLATARALEWLPSISFIGPNSSHYFEIRLLCDIAVCNGLKFESRYVLIFLFSAQFKPVLGPIDQPTKLSQEVLDLQVCYFWDKAPEGIYDWYRGGSTREDSVLRPYIVMSLCHESPYLYNIYMGPRILRHIARMKTFYCVNNGR